MSTLIEPGMIALTVLTVLFLLPKSVCAIDSGSTPKHSAPKEAIPATAISKISKNQGRIAIYKDNIPAFGAAANPEELETILSQAGFQTFLLNSDKLSNSLELNYDRYDVLVLPYGASFPVTAVDNFRNFLRANGKFVSMGGYAFDSLLSQTPEGWTPYSPPLPPSLDGAAWFYDIPAQDLRDKGRLTFSGFLKSANTSGPGFAHFSVYQIASDGSLPRWHDICQVRGTKDWQKHQWTFDVHPQAVTVSLRAGLYRCRGSAWFDDLELVDSSENALSTNDFEAPLNPDLQKQQNWWRSHKDLCAQQHQEVHSGSNALGATLNFVIPGAVRINTRHGRPEDGLEVEPGQLGVFQADYPLEHVQALGAAPHQVIAPPNLRVAGSFSGWASCGVVGWDTARWISLINGYDGYGRLRGSAGALLRHYAGPWEGSSWAFFGVTNRNQFSASEPEMKKVFAATVRSLVNDIYIAALTPDRGCYDQGESVRMLAILFSGERVERKVRLTLDIFPGEPSEATSIEIRPAHDKVATLEACAILMPARTNGLAMEWRSPQFRSDFYYVVGHLWDQDTELDRFESGFIVRNNKAIASGPALKFNDNYLQFGRKPLFLFGTDDWSYVFNTQRETPLQWLRDMRQRRDLGVLLYENLQFGMPDTQSKREQLFRKVDGIVQLAQEYDQVYMAGLLIGYNVAASDADLARQRNYCQDFARRYAQVPGLIYYLNGDYRCELNAAVSPHWNQFLHHRYGSDASLRQAWGAQAPIQSIGDIPSEEYHDWEQTWDDISAYDRNGFRAWLLRRWNHTLAEGIRKVDDSHPITGEFYQLPHGGVDLIEGIDGLDLANFGFFEKPGTDISRFPSISKYLDQRSIGKSGGPGEYGIKTHPAWGDGKDYGYHIARTQKQALDLYLAVPHYALGLGASRIHNWCWKDDAHRVFPWGMVYPCDGVPKPIAYAHRNQSLLFRFFSPVYETPEVCVLTPDNHRIGGAKFSVIDGVLNSMDIALSTHVHNLGALNEKRLNTATKSLRKAKVIFYPLPYCPSDETCSQLMDWVRHGGILYLSGDLSYDEQRRRTRSSRLESLCGVKFLEELNSPVSVNSTNASDQPCIRVAPLEARVLQYASNGFPLLVEHQLGRGRVLFTPDPIELHSTPERRARDISTYNLVLTKADIKPICIEPDNPLIHVFRVPLKDGGKVYVLFNNDPSQPQQKVTIQECQPVITITVALHRPALIWFDGANRLRAIESQGECQLGAELLWNDSTGGIILSLDQKAISASRALLLMPLETCVAQWRSHQNWSDPIIETGDICSGRWQSFKTQKPVVSGLFWNISIDSDQSRSIILITEKNRRERWCRMIENSVAHPENISLNP